MNDIRGDRAALEAQMNDVDRRRTAPLPRARRGVGRRARAWPAATGFRRANGFPKVLGSAEKLNEPRRASSSPAARRWRRNSRRPTCRRRFAATAPPSRTTRNMRRSPRNGFADYALEVSGLVAKPRRFTLAELRALPSRTQITRHDCVEGWSAIGKWQGAQAVGGARCGRNLLRAARYVVFHCADPMEQDGTSPYYESIDMDDAYHVQTLLAYALNDAPLPVTNGAPIRLRVERQLGYKHAKYVMRLELVESFAQHRRGEGRLLGGSGLPVVRRHLTSFQRAP